MPFPATATPCGPDGKEPHPSTRRRSTTARPRGKPPANLAVCWWGDAPLFAHAQRLFELRRFDVAVRFSPHAVNGSNRKELAARLHREVEDIFEPVVAPVERALETGFEPPKPLGE